MMASAFSVGTNNRVRYWITSVKQPCDLNQANWLAGAACEAVVGVDAVFGYTELDQHAALGSESLLVGGAAGIPDIVLHK
jgi:hypothetical protein